MNIGDKIKLVRRHRGLTQQQLGILIDIKNGAANRIAQYETGYRTPKAEIVEKMIVADVIVMAAPVYFYTMCGQMKIMIDRCCARYTEITNKEFYFIIAAAENDKSMMERTIDGFRGFLDCLENPQEKGVIYGIGAWKVGEIKDTPYLQEAYEMGKLV